MGGIIQESRAASSRYTRAASSESAPKAGLALSVESPRRDQYAVVSHRLWANRWRGVFDSKHHATEPGAQGLVRRFVKNQRQKSIPRPTPSTMFGMKPGMARRCWPEFDELPTDRAAFAVALLHLLLLPRSRTRNDVRRQIWRGRVLDVVIPGFDDVDRHAPFTVHTATPLVAPLAIRVALLAGLWRTQKNPDLYDRIESACSGRESIRIRRRENQTARRRSSGILAFAANSRLKSVLVSLFPAAKAKKRPGLKISCNVTLVLPARSRELLRCGRVVPWVVVVNRSAALFEMRLQVGGNQGLIGRNLRLRRSISRQ